LLAVSPISSRADIVHFAIESFAVSPN
jgi:hypothetical protein